LNKLEKTKDRKRIPVKKKLGGKEDDMNRKMKKDTLQWRAASRDDERMLAQVEQRVLAAAFGGTAGFELLEAGIGMARVTGRLPGNPDNSPYNTFNDEVVDFSVAGPGAHPMFDDLLEGGNEAHEGLAEEWDQFSHDGVVADNASSTEGVSTVGGSTARGSTPGGSTKGSSRQSGAESWRGREDELDSLVDSFDGDNASIGSESYRSIIGLK